MITSANIATMPSRQNILPKMIASIYGQFDIIRICANGFSPKLNDPNKKIFIVTPDRDLKDNGKFMFLPSSSNEVYFTLDDDIVYPKDYVAQTLLNLKRYPKAIVTYHGRKLSGTGKPYYRGHKAYRCLGEVHSDAEIDVPGSGCAAWYTNIFTPIIHEDLRQCMSDLILAEAAANEWIPVICCKHSIDWFGYLNPPEAQTIWGQHVGKPTPIQNGIADRIYKMKNEL